MSLHSILGSILVGTLAAFVLIVILTPPGVPTDCWPRSYEHTP
jgi:hypothetical protein